jgi:hypothetical protein
MSARRAPNRSAVIALALAAAPAWAWAGPVPRPGEEAGGLDLGIIGPKTPEILEKAKADPYAPPAEPACERLPEELAALDEALGPDADVPRPKHRLLRLQPAKWMGQAMRSAIPHRDVVRFLTGADRKQKALNDAAMAGWARRGYLKGLAKTLACTPPPAADETQQSAAAAAPPPQAAENAQAPAVQANASATVADAPPSGAVLLHAEAAAPAPAELSPAFIDGPTLAAAPDRIGPGDGTIAR